MPKGGKKSAIELGNGSSASRNTRATTGDPNTTRPARRNRPRRPVSNAGNTAMAKNAANDWWDNQTQFYLYPSSDGYGMGSSRGSAHNDGLDPRALTQTGVGRYYPQGVTPIPSPVVNMPYTPKWTMPEPQGTSPRRPRPRTPIRGGSGPVVGEHFRFLPPTR
jgi:hypothetical protein